MEIIWNILRRMFYVCANRIGRLIVTKRCDRDEDVDEDFEEITTLYKKKDGEYSDTRSSSMCPVCLDKNDVHDVCRN
jgi:hypothetical protein